MLKDSALPASPRYDSLVDHGHSARVHQTVVSGHIDIACNSSDTTVCLTVRTVPAVNQTVVSGRNENGLCRPKNIHAALLRFLAYFLTIQFDENITR